MSFKFPPLEEDISDTTFSQPNIGYHRTISHNTTTRRSVETTGMASFSFNPKRTIAPLPVSDPPQDLTSNFTTNPTSAPYEAHDIRGLTGFLTAVISIIVLMGIFLGVVVFYELKMWNRRRMEERRSPRFEKARGEDVEDEVEVFEVGDEEAEAEAGDTDCRDEGNADGGNGGPEMVELERVVVVVS